ncbi:class I SAM-dependent methyltransferase [Candidatus Uhrbacteria bacterium]|nr:class I SAM-dependent methyltransferase [Candidatus Uhrbacteria bacterium]
MRRGDQPINSARYLRVYSLLSSPEERQLCAKERYKEQHPAWDDALILLTKYAQPFAHRDSRVLDIGCGRGNYIVDQYRDAWGDVTGYDVSEAAAVGNTSCDTIVIGDGVALPFPSASFDLVLSLWTLEHLAQPAALFQEIHRVLRPGGAFLFTAPSKWSYCIIVRRLLPQAIAARWIAKCDGRTTEDIFPTYYRANTAPAIRALAQQSGLAVEWLQYNGDPSYLAGIPLLASGARGGERILSWPPLHPLRAHLVGALRRTRGMA